jgi:hypothetical protein
MTETLKEPFMRIDFAIVSLFDSEYKVDSFGFEFVVSKAKVPG